MSAIKESLENRIELLELVVDLNKKKYDETGEERYLQLKEDNLKELVDLKLALGQEISRLDQS